MSKQSPNEAEGQLLPFQALGKYSQPPMPTDESFRLLFARAKKLLTTAGDKPFIGDDNLLRADPAVLDAVAAPPAWGPLLDELQETVQDWVGEDSPLIPTKLIVLPPGEEQGLIEQWARQQGHQVLEAPARLSLVADPLPDLPDLAGEGVLVIPRLEYWFLRHHDGLRYLRQVLAAIHEKKRHCLIGCDSFAWTYLVRAIGADLILPDSLTFQPFDAKRLRHWFYQLDGGGDVPRHTVRLSQNGHDIFKMTQKGKLSSDYLAKLAARSRGIPWLAWDLWRSSLRSDLSEEEDSIQKEEIPKRDEDTLWVISSQDPSLPQHQREQSLLILHALLIHGRLTVSELRLVVPIVGESFLVAGLISCRFVQECEGYLSCNRRSLPVIREELFAAGLPVDAF